MGVSRRRFGPRVGDPDMGLAEIVVAVASAFIDLSAMSRLWADERSVWFRQRMPPLE